MLRPFWLALGFLTRIPVPLKGEPQAGEQGQSMLFYPLVGLVIGLGMMFLAWLLGSTSATVSAALLLLFWVLVTGALHLDGLADSVDAWLGSHGDRERALAIMKDPASGPAAVVVLVVVLLIKYAVIVELLEQSNFAVLV